MINIIPHSFLSLAICLLRLSTIYNLSCYRTTPLSAQAWLHPWCIALSWHSKCHESHPSLLASSARTNSLHGRSSTHDAWWTDFSHHLFWLSFTICYVQSCWRLASLYLATWFDNTSHTITTGATWSASFVCPPWRQSVANGRAWSDGSSRSFPSTCQHFPLHVIESGSIRPAASNRWHCFHWRARHLRST